MYRSDSSAAATMASSVIVTLWCASKVSRSPRRMVMVCSTVGSLTRTGWNRRSRAASFSMCFWYSLSVVAPIRFNSPRASIGLNELAMSRPPSPPPGARAHDGVQLVDEEDQVLLAGGDLIEQLLDALLELATVLGAGDQRVDVQLHQPLVAQILRNLSRQHPLRQPFHDGRLAHARLADQDRVVLLPAGEDLDHRLDLLRTADHGIELALLGEGGEIAAVLVEVRRLALRPDAALLGTFAHD